MSVITTVADNAQPDEMRHFFWRNYILFGLEGGLFMGGFAFVSGTTVLPAIIKSLGGPAWIIALVPSMMMLGFMLPPIFTAHIIDKLYKVKPLLLFTGIFQRLPLLFAALLLFFLVDSAPVLTLVGVALAPFLVGFFGGISGTAWIGLLAKTIPENRRSSVLALRFIMSSSIGLAAGGIIKIVLEAYPGTTGYGILFLITFVMTFLSYVLFALIHENMTHSKKPEQSLGLIENVRRMPALIQGDRQLANFMAARGLVNGIFIMLPYLSIHTLAILKQPESFLGLLVLSQMIGGIIGNILSGYVGDTFGAKMVLIITRSTLCLLSLVAVIAASKIVFFAIFFLTGFALFSNLVGNQTLSLEISPIEHRATYLSIMSFFNLISLLIASGICALVWKTTHNFQALAVFSVLLTGLSLYFTLKIKEPRRQLG